VDCPRCGSDNTSGEGYFVRRFCWLCGWDFSKGSKICEQCHNEIKRDEDCSVCKEDPTAGSADWNPEDDE